ncbi:MULTISPECIES: hypothetical protein [unclassified Paenibacillus]|uniref:hypothetical protein n=1 Tax=unclassified Paenibacillus TaxID=185978 RepID=UPI001AE236B6|nr:MULTISPECIES: hypothetical protein [unclassified Paenibacillus]MBP1153753.1 hypothetical protein [Paenibacillus sp. PvP091]MBP1170862.1 hypothetical protein [Paenibacillus sp. PvR098]MBP2441890.1 hypothetical protein [Paenibacillus sp. PvP052]
MAQQQIDANTYKKAEAAASLAKEMITQAIQQSAADPMVSEERVGFYIYSIIYHH